MSYKYTLAVPAASQNEADEKMSALAKLARQFDAKTLNALATKGPAIFKHPVYGALVRKNLGL